MLNTLRTSASEGLPRAALVTIATITIVVRSILCLVFPGFLKGDEVEVIQEGLRHIDGFPYEPWFLRNLFVSDVLVAPVQLSARALGWLAPSTVTFLTTLPFILLGGLNVVLTGMAASRLGLTPAASVTSTLLYAGHWIPNLYGSAPFPRTPAVTAILLAVVLVSRSDVRGRDVFFAGAAASLAFAVRYSEIVYVAGVFLFVLLERRFRLQHLLAGCAGFFAGTLITCGLWDFVTRGIPFSSLIEFAQFTLITEQSSASPRDQSWGWYAGRLHQWLFPLLLPGIVMLRGRAGRMALCMVLLPVVLLSCIHHKELRYLQAALPFTMIAVAASLEWIEQKISRRTVMALLVLAVVSQAFWIREIRKRSGNAVTAAEWIAARPDLSRIALSQRWAYGDRIWLEDRTIVEIGTPPDREMVEKALDESLVIALYSREESDAFTLAAAAHGFSRAHTFDTDRGRAVTVWVRTPARRE